MLESATRSAMRMAEETRRLPHGRDPRAAQPPGDAGLAASAAFEQRQPLGADQRVGGGERRVEPLDVGAVADAGVGHRLVGEHHDQHAAGR